MKYVLAISLLFLLVGCSNPTPEPIIITKVVKEFVPVKCNVQPVEVPNFNGLNRSQKLYTEIEYRKKLEAALDACK